MLTHNLFPITYVGGTLGSSLGFFISLHEGFFPIMPDFETTTSGDIGRQLEGIINLNHSTEYINKQLEVIPVDKKVSCRFNGWKRVEGPVVKRDDHRVIPMALWNQISHKIKPIIIEPNNNVLLPAQKRMKVGTEICTRLIEERDDKIARNVLSAKQSPKPILNLIENLYRDYIIDRDFLLIDIIKLYKNLDEEQYINLCNFIGSNPRHDWKQGLTSIKRITDFDTWF